jgi:hypothetical protein
LVRTVDQILFSLTVFTAENDPKPPERKLIFDDPAYHKPVSE